MQKRDISPIKTQCEMRAIGLSMSFMFLELTREIVPVGVMPGPLCHFFDARIILRHFNRAEQFNSGFRLNFRVDFIPGQGLIASSFTGETAGTLDGNFSVKVFARDSIWSPDKRPPCSAPKAGIAEFGTPAFTIAFQKSCRCQS